MKYTVVRGICKPRKVVGGLKFKKASKLVKKLNSLNDDYIFQVAIKTKSKSTPYVGV